ncbi:hypothetical protein [Streptomyces sp. JHA26]|uniref:hypothetical protein n=1 Tax=Streptomyces sp. JHA26 TaxID=1917143 RepID=UPI00098B46F6|nr:hypothetical protein [Streptomyces sp. JHA26]
MRMLQKAVITAATVGGLAALGSGGAYAADYSVSHCGGTQSSVAAGTAPQAQQLATGEKGAGKKKASKTVHGTTVRQVKVQPGRTLRAGGLLDGLLGVPLRVVTTTDGVNQNNQANGASGGTNQNNQANGASGGVNQNNQVNGASGGVNQNNQVSGPTIAIGLFAPAIQQSNLQQSQTA